MSSPNPVYITTPIYYVNGRPHIGHAYTTIAADVLCRYQRMKGRPTFFLTGTDEHGQKVFETAQAREMTPKAHCDDLVVHWKAMWDKLDIEYDRFIRTTDPDHIEAVQAVLNKLWAEGQIYQKEYTGLYSVSDEVFVTEDDRRVPLPLGLLLLPSSLDEDGSESESDSDSDALSSRARAGFFLGSRRVFLRRVTRMTATSLRSGASACVPATAKRACGKCVRFSPSSSLTTSKLRHGHSSCHACRQSYAVGSYSSSSSASMPSTPGRHTEGMLG